MATYRTFVRGKEKYSLSEKKQLGELISNHKKKSENLKICFACGNFVFLFSTIFLSKSS